MILALQNVSISYNGNTVIHQISLNIEKGIILGLVGPNGAGKTSLLKAILNLIPLSGGIIFFKNNSLNNLTTVEIVRQGISFTPQYPQTLNGMTVRDNVIIGLPEAATDRFRHAFHNSRKRREIENLRREAAEHLLTQVGLGDQATLQAGALSYGQKKRLDLARALAGDPELLLLDEPTAGLDEGGIAAVMNILRNISLLGKTILLVEHNMDAVKEICREIAVINFGEKIAQGDPQEVLKDPKVIDSYLGAQDD